MYVDTIDRAEADIRPERIAEFRKLAKLAGLPLSERITEAILQALAAGVTPTGDPTYILGAPCLCMCSFALRRDHRIDTAIRVIIQSVVHHVSILPRVCDHRVGYCCGRTAEEADHCGQSCSCEGRAVASAYRSDLILLVLMACSAILVLDLKGRVLLARDYRCGMSPVFRSGLACEPSLHHRADGHHQYFMSRAILCTYPRPISSCLAAASSCYGVAADVRAATKCKWKSRFLVLLTRFDQTSHRCIRAVAFDCGAIRP